MKKSAAILFFLSCIIHFQTVNAESPVSFENITTANGLIQNSALSIIQDKSGFMWIGTADGLTRYDGKKFVYYKHHNDDSTSLSDNFISELYQDKHGRIWIGTRNGLNLYDERKNAFIRISLNEFGNNIYIPAITEDHRGNLWIGTDGAGLLRLHFDTAGSRHSLRVNQFVHLKNDSTSIASNTVFCLQQDLNHDLWIGTEEGLCRLKDSRLEDKPGSMHFERVRICEKNNCAFRKERISDILNHGSQLWIGTKGKYIYCYDYSTFSIQM